MRHAAYARHVSCAARPCTHAGKTHLDAVAGYRASPSASTFTHQAMLWQVARLRACLGSPDPWQGLVSEFPEILDTTPLTPEEVISLYRSYVQEWEGLPPGLRDGQDGSMMTNYANGDKNGKSARH